MDDRDRRQVEIGAGLQESRLNTELIEWLQKWGPRVLYVLLAVVLAYLGWTRWQVYRQNQLDKAFAEYQAEQASKNPEVLLDVAKKFDGKGSIWTLATLDASDLLLSAGRLGVRPGVGPNEAVQADVLTPEERENMFRSALEHFQAALDRTKGDAHRARFAQEARWGIVSAQLSLGEMDKARKVLEEYIAVAEKYSFTDNLSLGKHRLEMLKDIETPIAVVAADQLPQANRPLTQTLGPATTAVGPASGQTMGGQTMSATLPSGETVPLRKLTPEEIKERGLANPDQGKETPGAQTPSSAQPAPAPSEPQTEPSSNPEPEAADPGAESK